MKRASRLMWLLCFTVLISGSLTGCTLTDTSAHTDNGAAANDGFWNQMSRTLHAPTLASDREVPIRRNTPSTGLDPRAREVESRLGVY